MRIHFHDEIDQYGNKVGEHVIHTERASWNQIPTPGNPTVMLDMIDYLKGLRLGTYPIAGTGWDRVTNHALYPGKTHLFVVAAEIVRLNDAAARAVLGV